MFAKLVAIVCILTHTLTPCCLAACRVWAEAARPVKPAKCALACSPSKGCCPAKKRSCAAQRPCASRCQTQAPAKPVEKPNCATCRCRPIKEPLGPNLPTPQSRSLNMSFTIVPDIERDAAPMPTCGTLALRCGHDPPGIPGSHNARLAQTAVWLK